MNRLAKSCPSLAAMALAWMVSVNANAVTPERLSPAGEAFVIDAQQGSKGEVVLGQMAADRAHNGEVKDFGLRLVKDHSKANKELIEFASRRDITLENDLSAEHRQLSDKLSELSGEDFDKAFVAAMIEDHQKDIAKFKTAADTLTDPFVVSFVQQTLPVLEEHWRVAETLQKLMEPVKEQRQ